MRYNDPNLWANRLCRALNRYTHVRAQLVTRSGGRQIGQLYTGVRWTVDGKTFEAQVKEVKNA